MHFVQDVPIWIKSVGVAPGTSHQISRHRRLQLKQEYWEMPMDQIPFRRLLRRDIDVGDHYRVDLYDQSHTLDLQTLMKKGGGGFPKTLYEWFCMLMEAGGSPAIFIQKE